MKKEFFLKLISAILSPVSPIITILVGGLVGLFFTNISQISTSSLFIILFFWLFLTVLYQIEESINKKLSNEKEDLKNDKENLKKIIEEKDLQIKNNIGLIEGKYGEFSKYILLGYYSDIMKKIIKNFSYVDAMQIYDYTINSSDKFVEIKLKLVAAEESESADINVLKQKRYKISQNIYKEYLDIEKKYNKIMDCNLNTNKKIVDDFASDAYNLLERLSCKPTAINQRIFLILVDMLKEMDVSEKYSNINLKFNKQYRTGILGTILSNRDYLYPYEGNNSLKKHRFYFSFCDSIDNENKIFTIVFNDRLLHLENIYDFLNEIMEYYEQLLNY